MVERNKLSEGNYDKNYVKWASVNGQDVAKREKEGYQVCDGLVSGVVPLFLIGTLGGAWQDLGDLGVLVGVVRSGRSGRPSQVS